MPNQKKKDNKKLEGKHHGGCCSSSSSSSSCCKRGPRGRRGPPGPPGPEPPCTNLVAIQDIDGVFTDCATPGSLTILDRDYYFTSMTLCNTISTNGYRMFIKNALVFNGGSIISNGSTGTVYAGAGANYGTLGGGNNGGGPDVLAQNSDFPNAGGMGGAGALPAGLMRSFYPASGGIGQTAYLFNNLFNGVNGRTLDNLFIYGGTGGGGAGVGVAGGGGGGGGVVGVYAGTVSGTGLIQAAGGAGNSTTASGGGGGGVIILSYCSADLDNITLDVSGGLGGSGGSNGSPGNVFLLSP